MEAMSGKLRWGLLSTARINGRLIEAVRASDRSEIAAVGSRTDEAAEAFAREWDIPRAYGSYEALVSDPDVDVVYLPLPNHRHAPWAVRAMRAGKHVLCEKPLALSVVQVEIMARAAEREGRILAEAFMYRHHPRTVAVRTLLRDGAIGSVRRVHGAFTFVFDRDDNWRHDPEQGGGALWDVGCYPVSFARYVLEAEPVLVWAESTVSPSGIDTAMAGVLRFPDDVLMTFDCGFEAAFRSEMAFVGTRGTIHVPLAFRPEGDAAILIERDGHVEERIVSGYEPLFLGEVRDMELAVLDGKRPAVALADSRANVAALCALQSAAETGRPTAPEL
jgi:predicted dehydrogenase